MSFLEKTKILSNTQLGFRNIRPRVTNLLGFYSGVIDTKQEREDWVALSWF